MKLSIVIICWNDLKVIKDCLDSIYATTRSTEFEIVVSDNGSTDGSVQYIHEHYPKVRIVENGANLGFARGNNAGIQASVGDYILILNPDTIILEGSLDRWIEYADRHPEAGAFGCRIINPNGTYHETARPFPTVRNSLIAALYLRPLGYLSEALCPDIYVGWEGKTERKVDWQAGCCVMFRGPLLKQLEGFDPRFFYHFEEVDLCKRVWQAGYPILFTPDVKVIHLGGQSVNRFPARFAVEKYRNRYRFFHKHYGAAGARRCRTVSLIALRVRQIGYSIRQMIKPTESQKLRLEMYRVVYQWNKALDPIRFVEKGEEPALESKPAAQTASV